MMSRVEHAVHNNVRWYETICRAHGIASELHSGIWLSRQLTPPYYSNAILFSAKVEVLEPLQSLIALNLPNGFSAKDAFAKHDLSALDFELLFEATWMYREATLPKPVTAVDDIRWTTVQNATELERWESAWGKENQEAQSRIFLPSLLGDQDIRFIAAYREGDIIAGVIANRTDDVVGVSNMFAPSLEFWSGCVATVMDAFPGLPLVGYERGDDLAVAHTLGFKELGALRAWVRQER
jgi:hypothetical protein